MGLFDFFQKDTKEENIGAKRFDFDGFAKSGAADTPEQRGPVMVFHPKSFTDVEKIIDSLKTGQQAMVYLGELAKETAYRVLDMLCGAVYALGGGVYELEKNIFMFTPRGIEVK